MGLWDMFKSKLGGFVQLPSNECLEYHKAMRASAHAQVTPVQVGFAFNSPSTVITSSPRLSR